MTKQELAKYAGEKIYALCQRMGGQFKTIHCLTVYKITNVGTLLYDCEVLSCVANKAQYKYLMDYTKGYYIIGRPTASKINIKNIHNLINA